MSYSELCLQGLVFAALLYKMHSYKNKNEQTVLLWEELILKSSCQLGCEEANNVGEKEQEQGAQLLYVYTVERNNTNHDTSSAVNSHH